MVVLLAQFMLPASLLTGAKSTGRSSQSELMRLTEFRPKTWLGAIPKTARLTTAIVLLNGSLINSCHAAPGVAVYGFMRTPAEARQTYWAGSLLTEQWSDRASRSDTIQPFERIYLHDCAIGRDHRKNRLTGTVGRRPEEGRPNRTRAQRAGNHLWLRRRGHNIAVGQAAHVNAADQRVGSPVERQASGVENGGRTPLSPKGAFAGQRRPKALLLDKPSGLLTPAYEAVVALWIIDTVVPVRTVRAEHLHRTGEG